MTTKFERRRVAELLPEALELEGKLREQFLAKACGNDRALRKRLEELLSLQDEAARTVAVGTLSLRPARPFLPRRIGPYRILEELGEGGMGVVYLAEQREPVHRRVALKLIKLGMDTREVMSRFDAERQALAMMNHPGISRMLEAGETDDGRPYFVMEYVRGLAIIEFCDRHRLGITERLELLLQVCEAITHAHKEGIVHRDIKPSNILVSMSDGRPVAKTIDFGVAKATNQRLTERTLYTELGRVVGTPAYMSPEQADLTGESVDHRTDVYSLGVVMYQLLVGELPFDSASLAKAAFDEVARHIREEDPPTPSTRWNRLSTERTAELSRARQCQPRSLSEALRGDLDWITMKAMDKAPSRRYQSVAELGADIRRHLAGEVVEASPPSAMVRVRRIARKHRRLCYSVGAVVALLTVGLIASAILNIQLEGSRRASETARKNEAREREHATRLLIGQQIANGLLLADSGDPLGALPWLAAPISLTLDAATQERHRVRFEAVLDRCPKLTHLWLHPPPAYFAEFSSDGKLIVTASGGRSGGTGEARIYEVATGRLRARISHDKTVRFARFDPESRLVLTASYDETARLWDARTGDPLTPPLKHREFVTDVNFCPSTDRFLSASADGAVVVRDLATGEERARFQHDGRVASAVFSPDGKFVLTASFDRSAALWNSITGRRIHRMAHAHIVYHARFDSAAQKVVTASQDGTARIWDVETGRELAPALSHNTLVYDATFSTDGLRVLTATNNGARIWNAATGDPITSIMAENSKVHHATFGPYERTVITAGFDGLVRRWDAATGHLIPPVLRHGSQVRYAFLDRSGRLLTVSRDDGAVRVWDLTGAATDHASVEILTEVRHLAFSTDGERLAVGGGRSGFGELRIWRTSGSLVSVARIWHPDRVNCLSFGPDGRRVATGCEDGGVRVWDSVNETLLAPVMWGGKSISSVAFNRRGDKILSRTHRGRVRIWESESGRLIRALPKKDGMFFYCAAFSPGGEHVATGSSSHGGESGICRVWDPMDGSLLRVLPHGGRVSSLCFNRSGRYLATGGEEALLRVWSVRTGDLVSTGRHQARISSLRFGAEGTQVLAASDDGFVGVWEARTGALNGRTLNPSPVIHLSVSPMGRSFVTDSTTDRIAQVWDFKSREALTAQIESGTRAAAFTPKGQHLALVVRSGRVTIFDLSPTESPESEIRAVAEVLAGRRIDAYGRLVPLNAGELESRWNVYRSKGDRLESSSVERVQWALHEAERLEEEGRLEGAIYYLNEVITKDPSAFHFCRRARVREALGDVEGAAKDLLTSMTLGERAPQILSDYARLTTTDLAEVLSSLSVENETEVLHRAHLFLRSRRWGEAARELNKVIQRGSRDANTWRILAATQILGDDEPAYRATCVDMINRFASSVRDHDRFSIVRTCGLADIPQKDRARVLQIARELIRDKQAEPEYLDATGALLLRDGQIEAAVKRIEEAKAEGATPVRDILLSMAKHMQGDVSESHRLLKKPRAWLANRFESDEATIGVDLLEAEVLLREAVELTGIDDSSE